MAEYATFKTTWGQNKCVPEMLTAMASKEGYSTKDGRKCKFKGSERKATALLVAKTCSDMEAEECAKNVNNLLGKKGNRPNWCIDDSNNYTCGVSTSDITNCDDSDTRTIYYDKKNVICKEKKK